jgi:hypothetical protein
MLHSHHKVPLPVEAMLTRFAKQLGGVPSPVLRKLAVLAGAFIRFSMALSLRVARSVASSVKGHHVRFIIRTIYFPLMIPLQL